MTAREDVLSDPGIQSFVIANTIRECPFTTLGETRIRIHAPLDHDSYQLISARIRSTSGQTR